MYLATAFLLLLLPRPVLTGYSRRGGVSPPSSTITSQQHQHWSSTGSQGLDHKTEEVKPVAVKRSSTKSPEDIDHPSRAFIEHHPYASGTFSMEPEYLRFFDLP